MKRIVIVILTAAALLLPLAAAAAPANGAAEAGQKFVVYRNEAHNLQLQYPGTWEAKTGTGMVVAYFVAPRESAQDPFSENVNIVAEDMSAYSLTVEQYTELCIANMAPDMEGFTLLGNRSYSLAGRPARQIEFTWRNQGYELHVVQVFFLANGKGYCITYTALEDSYARYLPVSMRIINSVVIK